MQLHLTTSEYNAVKWFSQINLKDAKLINGLYMIETYKKEILYDKPIMLEHQFQI